MAVHYTIRGRLLTLVLEGEYPPEDIIMIFDRALDDPALPPDARLMIDVRPSESVASSPTSSLRMVAEAFPVRAPRVGGLCAVVVEGLLQFGLMRMASVFSQAPEVSVQIFQSEDAAREWLGVDPVDG